MFDVELRKDEEVLCRLRSHGFCYAMFCLAAFFEAVVFCLFFFNRPSADLSGMEILPFIVYCVVYPYCQQVVFTNRRVICRGGMLLFREKSFALPEIKLFYNPLSRLLLKDYYMIKMAEDGRKFCFGGMAVNVRQLDFMRQKYRTSEQTDWFGLWWWR